MFRPLSSGSHDAGFTILFRGPYLSFLEVNKGSSVGAECTKGDQSWEEECGISHVCAGLGYSCLFANFDVQTMRQH